jgi:Zn-dependent M28 family amino/carboxypeptidase
MIVSVRDERLDESTAKTSHCREQAMEQILIMAHTDAFFQGALDNASGIAMMFDIARHNAAVSQARRPRTLVFLTTADHHHTPRALIGCPTI